MSMTVCDVCSSLVDTDKNPEFYREEYDNQCICDDCYQEFEDEDEESDDE